MAFVKLADNYTDLIGKFAVALLAEDVDRNSQIKPPSQGTEMSPSSRRAWIEMSPSWGTSGSTCSRPPRGGRG